MNYDNWRSTEPDPYADDERWEIDWDDVDEDLCGEPESLPEELTLDPKVDAA